MHTAAYKKEARETDPKDDPHDTLMTHDNPPLKNVNFL